MNVGPKHRRRTTIRFVAAGIAAILMLPASPREAGASPAALVAVAAQVLRQASWIGMQSAMEKVLGDRWKVFAGAFRPAFDGLVRLIPEGRKLEQGVPGGALAATTDRMVQELERNETIQLQLWGEFKKLHAEDQRAILGTLDRIERGLGRMETKMDSLLAIVTRMEHALPERANDFGAAAPFPRLTLRRTPMDPAGQVRSVHFGVVEEGRYKRTTTEVPCVIGQQAALHVHMSKAGRFRYRYHFTQPISVQEARVHPGETKRLSTDGRTQTVTGSVEDTDLLALTLEVDGADRCGPEYHVRFWVNDEDAADVRYVLVRTP